MRLSAKGIASRGTRVHSGASLVGKQLLGAVVGLAVLLLALPSLSTARTTRTTTAHTATVSSKKKPSKKRRNSSRQSTQKAPTPDRITEIQSALVRGGYFQGDPTGKWDSTTVAAMQKFQSSNGLEANGKLDALSLQKLGLGSDIAGVSAPKPIVSHGSASLNAQPVPGPSASIASPARESSSATSASGNLHGNSSVALSTTTTSQ
jgi:peptidoglycan hydrolase-like protein with peptidoglycan-binding domain